MKTIYEITVKKVKKFEIESEQRFAFASKELANYVIEEFKEFYKDQIGKNPGVMIFYDELNLFEDKSEFNINKNKVNSDPLRKYSKNVVFTGGRKRPFR